MLPDSMVLGFQVGLLSSALIAINNLRDREGDAMVGKRTLAARFGATFARAEIALFLLLPHVMLVFWWLQGERGALLALLVLPLGLILSKKVASTEPGPAFNKYLAMSSAHLLGFGIFWVIGMRFLF